MKILCPGKSYSKLYEKEARYSGKLPKDRGNAFVKLRVR